jgi:hypothetical protein
MPSEFTLRDHLAAYVSDSEHASKSDESCDEIDIPAHATLSPAAAAASPTKSDGPCDEPDCHALDFDEVDDMEFVVHKAVRCE